MNNYVIFTDSACDIKPELLKDWGVECIDLKPVIVTITGICSIITLN